LQGLHSRLPTPLYKSPRQAVPLLIKSRFPLGNDDKQSNNHFAIQYGQRLHTVLQTEPQRLAVHFGHQASKLPASGVSISGNPGQLDLLAWKKIIQSIDQSLDKSTSSKQPMPLSVNLMVDRLLLDGKELGKSSISGSLLKRQGTFKVRAGQAEAAVQLMPQKIDIVASAVDFDLLDSDSSNSKNDSKPQLNHVSETKMPFQYPSIHFICNQCKFKGLQLDEIVFDMPKQGRDALIRQLKVNSEYLSLQAHGHWKAYDQNQSQSYLVIDSIDIPKPNTLLTQLGHDLGIKGGKTSVNGRLQWRDSPFAFALPKLSGDLYVKVNQGSIPQIDPGAGKLLGLLNFSHLGKRLQLNFRDIPAEGVGFDSIIGNLQFDQGKLKSDDIILKSSVMLAGIKGETDLVAKPPDHRVTVIPDIKSALPVVGVLFGGIGIGAAVAMLDQITDTDEKKQLDNENVGMRYHISGTWDDPQVDEIQAISNDDFTSEDDFGDF